MEERPIECSQCKKQHNVLYKEIVDNEVTLWRMCQNCPILHVKLNGKATPKIEEGKDLQCSQCLTSLTSVLMGGPLGCIECYQIFQETLVNQLNDTGQISPRLKPRSANQTSTLHLGKSPHMNEKLINSARIHNLSTSLNQALTSEDYEEAAWLRDQINTLMEKSDEQP